MAPTVRPGTPADAPDASAVAEAAWWATYAGFLDADTVRRVVAEEYGEERLARVARDDGDDDDLLFRVAEADDGELVGFAVAERTWADTVDLHALYVHPDRWGEGFGGRLLDAVSGWSRERNVEYLRVAVFADNHAGVAFFEANGFERRKTVTTEVYDETHEEYVFETECSG